MARTAAITSAMASSKARAPKRPILPQDRAYAVLFLLREMSEATGCISDESVGFDPAVDDALDLNLLTRGGGWSTLEGAVAITDRGLRMVALNEGVMGLQEVRFPPTLWDRLSRLWGG